MKKVKSILVLYLQEKIPKESILISFLLATLATFFQYRFDLRDVLLGSALDGPIFLFKAMLFYGAPLAVFLGIWAIRNPDQKWFLRGTLYLLLLVTLFAFALRIGFNAHYAWVTQHISNWNYGIRISNAILLGPMMCILPVIWWFVFDRKQEPRLYGCSLKYVDWKAYFILLAFMVPLIVAASTQADFIRYYPKVARLFSDDFPPQTWSVLLYEFFYGLDFVYIEFFFRGFLVIAFARFLGPASIPFAALMYCTIHFGKPLGETISSWFGGMLLGILVLETRSIAGGIVVHMGIAWLMELGGWLGRILDF